VLAADECDGLERVLDDSVERGLGRFQAEGLLHGLRGGKRGATWMARRLAQEAAPLSKSKRRRRELEVERWRAAQATEACYDYEEQQLRRAALRRRASALVRVIELSYSLSIVRARPRGRPSAVASRRAPRRRHSARASRAPDGSSGDRPGGDAGGAALTWRALVGGAR
jgi:hypothetical protein